ncbi:MAG TPA: AraC family transcriptional regulator [Cytophagaceae bacterium]|jgi:AraC-like DNA-binding protein
MKLIFEKVPLVKSSFLFKEEFFPFFDIPWHNHPEYEIALLVKGKGKKIIGDNISDFADGDLIMVGPWLPHLWQSYERSYNQEGAHQLIIQFSEDFLGESFFERPEFIQIKKVFTKAARGLNITGNTKKEASSLIYEMIEQTPLNRVLTLIKILDILGHTNDIDCISNPGYLGIINDSDYKRMDKIYKYMLENFKKPIYLNDVAEIAHLTPPSFSRYFKIRTKKTFSNVLNEIRIGYATSLLMDTDLPINQIAYNCGFDNHSNFNQTFRKITGITPSMYLKLHKSG